MEQNDSKYTRQLAINECYFNGIGITGHKFDKALKEYNNFEMPLNERCLRIAEKKEEKFIEFLKLKFMEKKKLLFLDDYRDPFDTKIDWLVFSPIGRNVEVIWVKSYVEFVNWIKDNGLPDGICFDHDLADEHYDVYNNTDLTLEEYYYTNDREMTGYDCAKFLIDYCMDNNKDIPPYRIQSANPVGKENIDNLLKSYKKFRILDNNK